MTGMDTVAPPRLKLLIVDHSGEPGGGQLGLQRYLAQTSAFDREVVFLCDGPIARSMKEGGAKVRVLRQGKAFSRRNLLLSTPFLWAAVRRARPDAVLVNSGYAALVAAMVPTPGVPKIHYLRTEMAPATSSRAKRWFDSRFVYPRFRAFLANSRWTRSTISPRLAARPAAVAYPLSGVSAGDSEGREAACAKAVRPVRIASFSRVDRWKGLDTLVEAVGIVANARGAADVRLDIYGGSFFAASDFGEELRRRAAQMPFDTVFHGHISDVGEHMRRSDIVVVPSREPEPYGQVVTQALSHGCVVIVSNHGGAIEQVHNDHNGFTFEPGDAGSLASQITRALDSPGLASALTAHAGEIGEAMSDRALAVAFDDSLLVLLEGLEK